MSMGTENEEYACCDLYVLRSSNDYLLLMYLARSHLIVRHLIVFNKYYIYTFFRKYNSSHISQKRTNSHNQMSAENIWKF